MSDVIAQEITYISPDTIPEDDHYLVRMVSVMSSLVSCTVRFIRVNEGDAESLQQESKNEATIETRLISVFIRPCIDKRVT